MKNLIVVFVLFSSLAFGQSGIVQEAKNKLAKEHHEALVAKAKQLLQQKSDLEARLAKVNERLDKVDAGEDVEVPDANCYAAFSSTGGGNWTLVSPTVAASR